MNLRVIGRRDDGMHLIESEMVSISLYDEIVVNTSNSSRTNELMVKDVLELVESGFVFDSIPLGQENLVFQAMRLCDVNWSVVINKRIPPGAGLGGGSSDAAAILRFGANEVNTFDLASLGADVPFCYQVTRAQVSGIGEHIEQLPPKTQNFVLFLIPLVIPTKAVYAAFDLLASKQTRNESSQRNHLEEAALMVCPELLDYRSLIAGKINKLPNLAGSGSTYFSEGTLESLGLGSSESGILKIEHESLRVFAIDVHEVSVTELTPRN